MHSPSWDKLLCINPVKVIDSIRVAKLYGQHKTLASLHCKVWDLRASIGATSSYDKLRLVECRSSSIFIFFSHVCTVAKPANKVELCGWVALVR